MSFWYILMIFMRKLNLSNVLLPNFYNFYHFIFACRGIIRNFENYLESVNHGRNFS